ncbi:hypothetical protein [Vibrio barjaei]|uniref:hypothetical protein n=1 Tax=Vibrio barjaei TaxID=1676683 RepID=UPI002284A7B7|nr:hypothetical protein [Vibrio barjaei]MCY9872940.1 hypothetical protein [Vibrio barjaei]
MIEYLQLVFDQQLIFFLAGIVVLVLIEALTFSGLFIWLLAPLLITTLISPALEIDTLQQVLILTALSLLFALMFIPFQKKKIKKIQTEKLTHLIGTFATVDGFTNDNRPILFIDGAKFIGEESAELSHGQGVYIKDVDEQGNVELDIHRSNT